MTGRLRIFVLVAIATSAASTAATAQEPNMRTPSLEFSEENAREWYFQAEKWLAGENYAEALHSIRVVEKMLGGGNNLTHAFRARAYFAKGSMPSAGHHYIRVLRGNAAPELIAELKPIGRAVRSRMRQDLAAGGWKAEEWDGLHREFLLYDCETARDETACRGFAGIIVEPPRRRLSSFTILCDEFDDAEACSSLGRIYTHDFGRAWDDAREYPARDDAKAQAYNAKAQSLSE